MVDMETDLYLDDMNVAREANIILYIATIVGQSSEISDDSLPRESSCIVIRLQYKLSSDCSFSSTLDV
jgi:hypothetical protein